MANDEFKYPTQQSSIAESYDVAIVGAGPAGSAVALHLLRTGLKVLLIEKSFFDKGRIGESLAPAVQPLIQSLGLWQNFVDLNPIPSYGTRSIWGNSIPQDHSHLTTAWLNGWHVNRLDFDLMLAKSAVKQGAIICLGATVASCKMNDTNGFSLEVSVQEESYYLNTRFLIDASGRQSAMTRWLGSDRVVFDRLVGIAVQFETKDADLNPYTLVESTEDGWWYAAPINMNLSMVMLMTDGDLAGKRFLKQQALWDEALEKTTIIKTQIVNKRKICVPKIFSAVSQRSIRAGSDESPWIAVGDACLSVDPISGSGIVRALRTAKAGSEAVLSFLNGNLEAIANYELERNKECNQFLHELGSYYGLEHRWPDSVFWQRRVSALGQFLAENSLEHL